MRLVKRILVPAHRWVAYRHCCKVCLLALITSSLAGAQILPEQASQNLTANVSQRIMAQIPNAAILSFGTVTFEATGNGSQNGIVGAVRQTGTGGKTFPTGITGYGSMESAGNQAFGIFGRCDLGIHLMSAIPGTCTNELNAFNFNGPPSTMLPPNLAFGTKQNNAISLQLVAYGDYDSSIALNFAGGGGAKQFYVGEYINPQNSIYSGIFVDATSSTSAKFGAILKATAANVPLRLQTVGNPVATNAVEEYYDGRGVNQFTLDQAGDLTLGGSLSTRSVWLAAGGSITLSAVSVASLPACNSKLKNTMMAVTDAATPVYNGPLRGGGNISIPAFCNGATWTAH
jgi:hypothetical protein